MTRVLKELLMLPGSLRCRRCGRLVRALFVGRCWECDAARGCDSCPGTYRAAPTPEWPTRFVCDGCGREVSR